MCFVSVSQFNFESFGFVKIALWFLFQKPIYLLKTSTVTLSIKKGFLVWLLRFLRRCLFQVVSVTGFETAPDLSFLKRIKKR
ncbi:hypothetical protein DC850_23400 [Vibrio parahaemolyticus]|nr:hypothetical protein [Vibrio parahaemolyticus]EGR3145249.1 hypothetical protein [Vibrio parahaemolyticus]EGR3181293.1 hypothetical protein [Vibrio parahaemolyticus]EGR3195796.1 hypothetical protein [Vibrio parahaemolyticus]EGR3289576.1 hypothetical protein [Vibrio parahaemolyticus]